MVYKRGAFSAAFLFTVRVCCEHFFPSCFDFVQDLTNLTERLAKLNDDLGRKIQARNEFDATIQETEAAYMKVRLLHLPLSLSSGDRESGARTTLCVGPARCSVPQKDEIPRSFL